MKTSFPSPTGAVLLGLTLLASPLWAQSSGDAGRRTIPTSEKLSRQGQVATAAEAKPLIEQYHAEQEQFFQERREAILRGQGKTPEEQLKIMAAVTAEQRERRRQHRQLEARISAMLKQERENHSTKKEPVGGGK